MHCAQCGRLLPSANAICAECDRELSAPSRNALNALGDQDCYTCPQCQQHFDQHITALYPPNAPWYRPQVTLPACPHCKTAITWLKLPRPSIAELRWHRLSFLAAIWPTALLFFYGKQLANAYLTLALTAGLYFFTVAQGRKVQIAPTPLDDSGQWVLAHEAKALQRQLFGLPAPWLILIWLAIFAGLMALLPLTVMVYLAAMLAAFSAFAAVMAWRSTRQAKAQANAAPKTAPTAPAPLG